MTDKEREIKALVDEWETLKGKIFCSEMAEGPYYWQEHSDRVHWAVRCEEIERILKDKYDFEI